MRSCVQLKPDFKCSFHAFGEAKYFTSHSQFKREHGSGGTDTLLGNN